MKIKDYHSQTSKAYLETINSWAFQKDSFFGNFDNKVLQIVYDRYSFWNDIDDYIFAKVRIILNLNLGEIC
jgi:hypothetical protein